MTKREKLRKTLSKDLLGKIPLFFTSIKAEGKNATSRPVNHVRSIEVEAYETSNFHSRGYHKPISKIA